MEPLKREVVSDILRLNPAAQPSDIAEYERLLAQRFTIDPDLAMEPSPEANRRERRIRELYAKLISHRESEK